MERKGFARCHPSILIMWSTWSSSLFRRTIWFIRANSASRTSWLCIDISVAGRKLRKYSISCECCQNNDNDLNRLNTLCVAWYIYSIPWSWQELNLAQGICEWTWGIDWSNGSGYYQQFLRLRLRIPWGGFFFCLMILMSRIILWSALQRD